jgi:hypothetical protein
LGSYFSKEILPLLFGKGYATKWIFLWGVTLPPHVITSGIKLRKNEKGEQFSVRLS